MINKTGRVFPQERKTMNSNIPGFVCEKSLAELAGVSNARVRSDEGKLVVSYFDRSEATKAFMDDTARAEMEQAASRLHFSSVEVAADWVPVARWRTGENSRIGRFFRPSPQPEVDHFRDHQD